VDIGAYLRRIGLSAAPERTLDGLAELGLAHLCAVPFENLDIAGGRALSLDLEEIYDKIVVRRRGGFCYSSTGSSLALRELGFAVTLLAGQLVDPVTAEPGPERAHLCSSASTGRGWSTSAGAGHRRPSPFAPGTSTSTAESPHCRLERRTTAGRWSSADDSLETNLKATPRRIAYRFDLQPHSSPTSRRPAAGRNRSRPSSHDTAFARSRPRTAAGL
jgi:N-hydroxyarylamine O-acetyltransferase